MMHHPNMHHQAMSGHPQHLPGHQLQAHHQMPPPQMHRDSRHVTLARMPMGPGQAGGMAHTQMGGMGAMGVPHHAPQRPPHPIRPMHHPQPHHTVPQQMKPLRRAYMGAAYGAGAPAALPPPYAPPPLQPPPPAHPPAVNPSAAPAKAPKPAEAPDEPADKEPAPGDAEPRPAAQANSKEKTPMCLVNELARYNKIKHQYRLTSETGPAHKKVFTVTLRLGETEEYTAEGSSIKRAQHAAAAAALAGSGFPAPPPRAPLPHNHHAPPRHSVMPTVELNALAMKLCEPAVYSVVPRAGAAYRPPLPFHCPPALSYRVRVCVGGRAWLGEGATPQAARHDAAARALRDLRQNVPPPAPPDPAAQPDTQDIAANTEELLNSEVKSPVSLVHELALKRNLVVTFSVKCERGPPHMRVFVTACTVGDMETEGEGNGKKVSKRRAAEKMLDEMRARWGGAALPRRPAARKHQPAKRKPRNLVKVSKRRAAEKMLDEMRARWGGAALPRRPAARKHQPAKRKPRNLVKEGGVCSPPAAGGADNPISRLAVARHAGRARSPVYTVIEERGAARRREFLVQCEAPPHTATGRGPNKKTAKRRAAMNVLLAMEIANGTSNGEVPATTTEASVNGGGDSKPATQDVKRKEGEAITTTTTTPAEARQPVPGVLLMDYHPRPAPAAAVNGVSETSPLPTSSPSSPSGSSPGAKDQLMYLSQLLGFSVQFSDFPKRNHGEFLSLVSLGTQPPVMCHGGGASTRSSHEQCARAALTALELMGLDHTPAMQSIPSPAKPSAISNVISE